MKSLQKQQPVSQFQAQLNEYLTLKPHRAVDRLLQQNELQQCFQIYNLLQQNIKSNTTQLRSVLYNNHENLHQCSQTIRQIQQFAQKVRTIQQTIDELIRTEYVEDDYGLQSMNLTKDPIAKIQELMNEKKFTLAIKQCTRYLSSNDSLILVEQPESEYYYINFLKVEIIQKLERFLQNTPLDSDIIQQAIATIRQFMAISSVQDLYDYIEESAPSQSQQAVNTSNQEITLFKLLYEKYYQEQDQNIRKYPIQEEGIMEVIFKFKLLTLKKSTQQINANGQKITDELRIQFLYNRVFNYFADLTKILQEGTSKSQQNQQKSNLRLYEIFSRNIHKTVKQISQIFITDKSKTSIKSEDENKKQQQLQNQQTTLTFQNDLYEKLINSEQFIDVIKRLQRNFDRFKKTDTKISSNNNENQIFDMIKNLWRDFYHQMLDIITQKINPSLQYKFQQPYDFEIIDQFRKFTHIPYQKLTKQKIIAYKKQLSLFFNNFIELLKKSKSPEEKNLIVEYFLKLKEDKIDHKFSMVLSQLENQVSQYENSLQKFKYKKQIELKIREIITLFLLTHSYNNAWILKFQQQCSEFNVENIQLDAFLIEIYCQQKSKTNSQQFYSIFNKYIETKTTFRNLPIGQKVQKWQQQFDILFGPYFTVLQNEQNLIKDFKQFILTLIKTKLNQLQTS